MCANKYISVISILIVIVMSIQYTTANREEGIIMDSKLLQNLAAKYGRPPKRVHQIPLNATLPPIDPNGPCAPYNPPPPDFRAPGRRISDISNDHSPLPEVFGGHPTKLTEYPNMGAIGWKTYTGDWKFMCGGSLISSKFVLTVAHCSQLPAEQDSSIVDLVPKIVRLGVTNILDRDERGVRPTDKNIIKVIVHPNYEAPKKYYDIALLELENEVTFSWNLQPACLWTDFAISSIKLDKANVTGWGMFERGNIARSPNLLAAEVDIINSTTCDDLLKTSWNRNWHGLQEQQICAGKLIGGVDACEGDSGGPLQVKMPIPIDTEGNINFVVGLTAFGKGCGLSGLPGVYTRVSSYVDWIEGIVWPGEYVQNATSS